MLRNFLIICLCCSGCQSVYNFTDPDGPAWRETSNAVVNERDPETIRVISYNVQYSKKINEAILELQTYPNLMDADVIMLQEMDTLGVQQIAAALNLSSVYYPAATHGKDHSYFGNAILSKWPIIDSHKIVLPHLSMFGRQRIGVAATVQIGSHKVQLVNVHFETMTMKRRKRVDQLKEIISFVQLTYSDGPLLVAGDFNSFFPKDRKRFSALMAEAGIDWASQDIKYTARALGGLIKPTLDLIFVRELDVKEVGVERKTKASDHLPVFVELGF